MAVASLQTDARIEDWIKSHGGSPSMQEINIDDINRSKSLANQSRFQALDEDTVVLYASAMERGDVFPPIVVYRDHGSFVVIDGNHRVEAATLNQKTKILAYVLDKLSTVQVQTMTFEANAKHGLPATVEERISHGLYLTDLGVTHRDAAAMVNVPLHQLQKEIERARIDRRLGTLGIERWNSIAAGARLRMESIRNDNVLRAAARMVVESRINTVIVNEMVTVINREKTEKDQLAVVEEWRARYAQSISTTAGGRVPTPRSMSRLSRSLAYTEGIEPQEIEAAVRSLNPDQKEAMAGRMNRAILILMEAKRSLEQA